MGIDTPSDEFYNIHTTQYVPPMSARHKLQARLPKPNQSPETSQRNKPIKDGLVLFICQHIYTNFWAKRLEMLNKNTIQKQFISVSPHEIYMK